VLTVEYKINFMAPGDGERLVAHAQVIKAGRTLAVCESDVFVFKGQTETRCAASLQTLIYINSPPGDAA
jgi:acyl-coenzyme A thioesterase PaaI-like protein